ncbi:hypothetical protein TPHA_0I02020 [Tetrapisispora phaffii CBS 4417]|uniref:Stress-associated endoplasmic reticulum protein n=1 Tax=Tetrapisispora phaffii (strain ATCC 24235 / CBS 4417 / NBRC 1672 / NRRL Y-8282 / UCD 70-5) TaxID=1071381 RepID=G8BXS8_TETPH|nr:hypothetical protein TPHA_0I02020 [Tetrapisispora phaffii CBS 4417]CCE64706.1 hypothetical protein TPHA_0I02020 [Tetrapisispora phaffii CBS 4417]
MASNALKQKLGNEKFKKRNEHHRKLGKKKIELSKKKDQPPISKVWIYILAFLIVGGGILEIISLLF